MTMYFAEAISPGISPHTLLTSWQTGASSLVTLVVEVGLAASYLLAVRRLARRGRYWSPWRTVCFLAAILSLVVAVQSGLAAYDDSSFGAHVVQHLLLMNVAPVFFALSAPMTLALQASGRPMQERLLKVLHHPIVAVITHPIVAAALAYGTMLVYFLSPFYNLSLEHPLLHELTHLHFLISGCLFWWVIIGKDPSRWRLSYPVKLGLLATGIPVTAFLGLALTGARKSIAPNFHTVADVHAGGSLLWVAGELTMLIAMGLLVFQWMHFDEREAVRADRRADQANEALQRSAD